ncbi:putative efflux pump antibiotic resistance protein [Daldinia vernicosa]|uniref:putative efflux pump antibiotic resistance protein n=1 Tax=Daldinia vernicosa TaxID=114800 RepID=UPI002007E273|nr:putative efflux pump antibiotic resistance protein [Daldinia vernicosa]KAI0850542.1 putative efflux pump antibiotic resistance protein [Daldinia vernicosa]
MSTRSNQPLHGWCGRRSKNSLNRIRIPSLSPLIQANTPYRKPPSRPRYLLPNGVLQHPNPETTGNDEPRVERGVGGLKWLLVILAVLSSTFLYALDNTVTASVRPSMIETFGNRVDMPCFHGFPPRTLWEKGTLYKLFNNKLLYLIAVLIFEIGSAVIGSARSIEAVIAGRAVASSGGSGIYVGTINIISDMTAEAERAVNLNHVGMCWCLGTILGPVIGGAFADSSATWRWAFYINICIAAVAVAAPACIFLVPSSPPRAAGSSLWTRVKRIDYIGATLFLRGTLTIIMVLSFGGALYSWTSGQMIGLYVATAVIWSTFGIQQCWNLLTVDRIFPVQFFSDWAMAIFFCCGSLAIANVVMTVYSLPLLFQFVYGDTALGSAAYTIPFVASTVVFGGAAGPLFNRYPVYMPWFTDGAALMLIGNGLLTTIGYAVSRGAVCGYTVIQGAGCGPVTQLGYTVAQIKARRADPNSLPDVTGFMSCSQMAGLALSLGIATTIFLNGTTRDIAIILPGVPRSVIQATIDGAGTSLVQGLSPELQLRVLEAIANNVATVFYMNIAGAGLGLILSLFLKREKLQLGLPGR